MGENKMTEEHIHTMICENCGNEANMIIKEEESRLAEHGHEHVNKPKRKVLVCKECGNEANMILEEIEVDD